MKYATYKEMEGELEVLLKENKYEEVVDLLKNALQLLPKEEYENNYFEIVFNKARFQTNIMKFDECIKTLINLVEQGYACPLEWSRFEPLKHDERYNNLMKKNNILLKQANQSSKNKYVVHLPEEYNKDKKYPLFINLHGDGENMEIHKQYWKPDNFLDKGFIVVYIQSSQVIYHNGFAWTKDPQKAKNEIKYFYDLIKKSYSINTESVIIGGFSGGAITSIDVTMSNEIPIKGFISLCGSDKPQSFTKENVKLAYERGVKGVMMEGEYDVPVPDEEEMLREFKEIGFPHEYYINKEIGHWYPNDLSEKVEQALHFILKK